MVDSLTDQVDLYDGVALVWELKQGQGSWQAVATNRYRVAALLNNPIGPYRQATVIYGCESARGATNEAGFMKALKQRLVDRERPAKNAHGKVLGYYRNWNTQATTCQKLLDNADGQCGAWGQFLVETLRVQGILEGEFVLVIPTRANDGFLVKNWSRVADWPAATANLITFVTNKANAHGFVWEHYPPFNERGYTWGAQPFRDEPGLPGQSTPNPASSFNNHVVVQYGTELLDPSYGAVYRSLHQMSTNAIFAFYTPRRNNNQIQWTVRTNDGSPGTLKILRLLEFKSDMKEAMVGIPQKESVVVKAAKIGGGAYPGVRICLILLDPAGKAQLKAPNGILHAITDAKGEAVFSSVTVTTAGQGLRLEAYPENEELELPRIQGRLFNARTPEGKK